MSKTKVLVLGGVGFVGSCITQSLRHAGFHVFRGTRQVSNIADDFTYPTEIDPSFFVQRMTEDLEDRGVSWIVNAANEFRRGSSPEDSTEILKANLFFPAAVLQAALNSSAIGFINIASGWQISSAKVLTAPNYVATKQGFRFFLASNSNRLITRTIFVNEVFGPGDSRKKLINLAIKSLKDGKGFELEEPHAALRLVFGPRLGNEVAELIKKPDSRPPEYLYENYSFFTAAEVIEILEAIILEPGSKVNRFRKSGVPEETKPPMFGVATDGEFVEELRRTVTMEL